MTFFTKKNATTFGNALYNIINTENRTCWCTYIDGVEAENTKSYFEDPSLLDVMTCKFNDAGSLESNFKGEDIYVMEPDDIDVNNLPG